MTESRDDQEQRKEPESGKKVDSADILFQSRLAWLMFVGLALFGTTIATGSYFFGMRPDFRKPLIVCGFFAAFVGAFYFCWHSRFGKKPTARQ